ncbi:MgtC/SapB family protein [Thermocoleostomius sinensis]|uniref:MgtC/SapB family protein n=1 Tax=Thermocoleostomius sinensis A174 TaxID=2016057 RepID=A0A9E8ZEP3_9CYAN|nr:MgtC/SapB family protein [Thermocoleostomius sinensis]WAL61989.1 MgtC/SapB family protein [Thermocoleostomius sinensis A174]
MTGIELLYPLSWEDVVIRLSLAVILGGLIGWEREVDSKPAGLRTHMLVSLGSAMLVMTAVQSGMVRETADTISRIIQGIVTGIGFLGAGEIVSVSNSESGQVRVRGLTSAAAIWVAMAIGIAVGCGLWQIGTFGAIATFVILWGVKKIETRLGRR